MAVNRVLFVEDDPSNVIGTVELLKNEGIQVDMVETLDDAKEALKGTQYELLLLDWALPLELHGPCDMQAGQKLIDLLKDGSLGLLNNNIPYFVITKHIDQFDTEECDGRLGVLTKLNALEIRENVVEALAAQTA